MKINRILIIVVIETIISTRPITTQCGLPAIPFNAQINLHQVKPDYDEGESVDYHCELEELKLIGASKRTCVNGRWMGAIPRCVEELDSIKISGISIVDRHNGSLLGNDTIVNFEVFKANQCMESSEMTKPQTWSLHLAKPVSHISYMEIRIMNKNNNLSMVQAKDLIQFVKINDLRECEPQVMEWSHDRFRLNIACSFQYDSGIESDDWSNDKTNDISFEVTNNELTICEMKIFKTPDRVHHWCGSADVVPHSRRIFVRKNKKYSGISHYRYYCDQGFQLDGNQDVRCGADNYWVDIFPKCKPEVNCPFKPPNLGIIRHMVNTYHSDGIITAVVGTLSYYFCEEDSNNWIMIGDSVRVCGTDGEWSGVNPICIRDNELQDYLEHIEDINENLDQLDSSEAFDNIVNSSTKEGLSCGIPAMPLFAKPITQPRFKHQNRHADLRSTYPNGTVISYQCESANALVTGDFEQRICLNGQWVGTVGKCAINLGNKFTLNSITLSHLDEQGQPIIDNINELNNTDFKSLNKNFVFRYDPTEGLCYNFTAEKRQQWTLRLDKGANISYFMVMLYPGGFFNGQTHVINTAILELSPLSAKTHDSRCSLTSAWDYNQSKIGTYFHFTCDLTDTESDENSEIILDINLDKITEDFATRDISLCSLEIFTSKNECGTPDIPLHGSVERDNLLNKWSYHCDKDYELEGESSVICGLNGWLTDFPLCRRKNACSIIENRTWSRLQVEYKNLMEMNDKKVSPLDSVANYSCLQTSNEKSLLIGSKLRACIRFNGYKWSGSQPFCLDPNELLKEKVDTHLNVMVVTIVISGVCLLIFILIIVYFARKKMKIQNNIVDNINLESPYSL